MHFLKVTLAQMKYVFVGYCEAFVRPTLPGRIADKSQTKNDHVVILLQKRRRKKIEASILVSYCSSVFLFLTCVKKTVFAIFLGHFAHFHSH